MWGFPHAFPSKSAMRNMSWENVKLGKLYWGENKTVEKASFLHVEPWLRLTQVTRLAKAPSSPWMLALGKWGFGGVSDGKYDFSTFLIAAYFGCWSVFCDSQIHCLQNLQWCPCRNSNNIRNEWAICVAGNTSGKWRCVQCDWIYDGCFDMIIQQMVRARNRQKLCFIAWLGGP